MKIKNYEVVFYMNIRLFLVVKCSDYFIKNIDIFCDECNVFVCFKCIIMLVYRGYFFIDLEIIYLEKYEVNIEKI